MLVAGIDFETTGLETDKDRITEVGAVIFDTANNWAPVREYNRLVWDPTYKPQVPEVIKVTGITDEMLQKDGVPFLTMFAELLEFLGGIETLVAHNAPFDSAILDHEGIRHGVHAHGFDWICSARDLKSNKQFKSWRLAHLALDYGVTVNPKLLHRAVDDVKLMGQMLAEAKADVNEMIKYMRTPDIIIRAVIPKPWEDGGKGKDAAKERGYSWQQPRGSDKTYPNCWVKIIKEDDLDEEQRTAPFKVQQLKGE